MPLPPINTKEYLETCEAEIAQIESALQSRTKKSMQFQTLHFTARRRTRAHINRTRYRKRTKPHWSFLHTYFSKRYKTKIFFDQSVPIVRYQKSSSLINKGKDFIFMTHYKCFVYLNDENLNLVDLKDLKERHFGEFEESKNHFNRFNIPRNMKQDNLLQKNDERQSLDLQNDQTKWTEDQKNNSFENLSGENEKMSKIEGASRKFVPFIPKYFSNKSESMKLFKFDKFLILLTLNDIPTILSDKSPIAQSENVFKLFKPEKKIQNEVKVIDGVKVLQSLGVDEFFDGSQDLKITNGVDKKHNVPFITENHTNNEKALQVGLNSCSNDVKNKAIEKYSDFSHTNSILYLSDEFPFLILFSLSPKTLTQFLLFNYYTISLTEYLRISLEYMKIPEYMKNEDFFREVEKVLNEEDCLKWWRTPIGKRKIYLELEENFIKNEDQIKISPNEVQNSDLSQHTGYDQKVEETQNKEQIKPVDSRNNTVNHNLLDKTIHFDQLSPDNFIFPYKISKANTQIQIFESENGLERGSRVFFSDKLVGYVIYSHFSYRFGKNLGFCMINESFDPFNNKSHVTTNSTAGLYGVELFSDKKVKIKITKEKS